MAGSLRAGDPDLRAAELLGFVLSFGPGGRSISASGVKRTRLLGVRRNDLWLLGKCSASLEPAPVELGLGVVGAERERGGGLLSFDVRVGFVCG